MELQTRIDELTAQLANHDELQVQLIASEEKASKIQADYDAFELRFTKVKNEFNEKMLKRRRDNNILKEQLAAAYQANNDLSTEIENAKATNLKSLGSNEDTARLVGDLEMTKTSLEAVSTDLETARQASEAFQQESNATKAALEISQKEIQSIKLALQTSQHEVEKITLTLETAREETEKYKVTAMADQVKAAEAKTALESISAQMTAFKNSTTGLQDVSQTADASSSELQTRVKTLQAELELSHNLAKEDLVHVQRIAELESENQALHDQVSRNATLNISAIESGNIGIEENSSILDEEIKNLKAINAELQNQIVALQAGASSVSQGEVTGEELDHLRASNNELSHEVSQLQTLVSSSASELDAALLKQREELEAAHAHVITKLNSDAEQKVTASQSELDSIKEELKQELVKANELRLNEIKSTTMQKMKSIISQKEEILKTRYEEEYAAKVSELEGSIAGGNANDLQKLREGMEKQQQEKVRELESIAMEDKKKAVEQAREATKRETEMRLKLLMMKAEKSEKGRLELVAQLAALQGTGSSGVAITSPAPVSRHIPHLHTPTGPSSDLQQSHAMPSTSLPQPSSGLSFAGASQLPRGSGSRFPVTGIPRTGIPRAGLLPRPGGTGVPRNPRLAGAAPNTSASSGIKRPLDVDRANLQAQLEQLKRRKESDSKNKES